VELTWTESDPTATGFNVYRLLQTGGACAAPGVPSSTTYTKLNTSQVGTTSYKDDNPTLVPTSTYCYAVTALNSGGAESGFSNVAMATIP